MKKLWLSSLDGSKEGVQKFMKLMKPLGLEVNGHFWENDLGKMAWSGPRKSLLEKDMALWAIIGSDEDFSKPDVRYGLSLLAFSVQGIKGQGFPIVVLQTKGDSLNPETLPTPLKGATVLSASQATLGAKLVAMVHKTVASLKTDYHIDIYGNPEIGQWFEVGSSESGWNGAMFGISEGEILFHAVGPRGRLPSETVLNYPMKGLKLDLGETAYEAWAVQNPIDIGSSYFVKVEGHPDSIIFGPYTTEDEAEVYVIRLK
jgi:hypothetical protein